MGDKSIEPDQRKYKYFNKKKLKAIPSYLKKGLPDQRFLDFRLFIHNRKVNEVQHDLKFFEPMLNINYQKKRQKSLSEYKQNKLYKMKKQQYQELFTNGQVDIEINKISNSFESLKKKFHGLNSRQAARLNNLMEKVQKKKKKQLEMNMQRPRTSTVFSSRLSVAMKSRVGTSFREYSA